MKREKTVVRERDRTDQCRQGHPGTPCQQPSALPHPRCSIHRRGYGRQCASSRGKQHTPQRTPGDRDGWRQHRKPATCRCATRGTEWREGCRHQSEQSAHSPQARHHPRWQLQRTCPAPCHAERGNKTYTVTTISQSPAPSLSCSSHRRMRFRSDQDPTQQPQPR